MTSVDVIKGRDGRLLFPAEWAYFLDEVNARVSKIAAERDKPGRPFEGAES